MQTPTRSGSATRSRIALSCSKRQPSVLPCPAVFSSSVMAPMPDVSWWTRSSALAIRAIPSCSLLVVWAPGCATTQGTPSDSARNSSTRNASIDFSHSAPSGLARFIRYESCDWG